MHPGPPADRTPYRPRWRGASTSPVPYICTPYPTLPRNRPRPSKSSSYSLGQSSFHSRRSRSYAYHALYTIPSLWISRSILFQYDRIPQMPRFLQGDRVHHRYYQVFLPPRFLSRSFALSLVDSLPPTSAQRSFCVSASWRVASGRAQEHLIHVVTQVGCTIEFSAQLVASRAAERFTMN